MLVVYTPDIKFNIVGIDNSAANTVLRADSTEYYQELADGCTTSLVIVHESPGNEEHIYYHNGKLWDHTGRILDRNSIEIEDKSFTVSFDLQGKLVSEHSHTPGMYITTTRNLRSCSNGITYLHNSYKMPISVRSFVDIVTKFPRLVRIQSAIIDSQVFNEQGQLIPKREFDKIMVHNDTQCSGELVITGTKGRSGALVFNNFLDIVGEDTNFMYENQVDTAKLNAAKPKRFFGTYVIIRLITEEIEKNYVLLYSAAAKAIPV